jgi:hydroxymethylbilane synthase
VLDGSCRTPIAGHAVVRDGRVRFQGQVLRPDGSESREIAEEGAVAEAAAIGLRAGEALRAQIPAGFMGVA